jgi:hypothetical protein
MELIAAIGFVTIVALAAQRFGTDSRERYVSEEEILASRGVRWNDGPSDELLAAELVAARASRESAGSRPATARSRRGNLRPTEA